MKRCKEARGKIHSMESFGTHEGPGIRYVIFMQGCLARCLYCHNPDTWGLKAGKSITAKEAFRKVKSCLPYMRSSRGGITISGGEPLLQTQFITGLFKLCKKEGIHTAIDTSGFYAPKKIGLDKLIGLTDLFIIDIKAAEVKLHKKMTSRNLKEPLALIARLEAKKRPFWVRYVLVPGLNDSGKAIMALKETISSFKYMQKCEFLPYQTLGVYKWRKLGLKYKLGKLPAATDEDVKKAETLLKSTL